jgi:Tfp pilus assembly protein PilO
VIVPGRGDALRVASRHPWVRYAAVALVASALAVIAAAIAWWPVSRAHEASRAAIDEQRRAIVLARQADALAAAYQRAVQEVPKVEQKLARDVGQAELVQGLARLAQRSGVRLLGESYEDGKPEGGYTPLHAEVSVQGAYAGLRDFLQGVPELPMWGDVQEMRIERARDGQGIVKARLRLVMFRKTAPARGEERRS